MAKRNKVATIKHYVFLDTVQDFPSFSLYISGKHVLNFNTQIGAISQALNMGATTFWIHDIREYHVVEGKLAERKDTGTEGRPR